MIITCVFWGRASSLSGRRSGACGRTISSWQKGATKCPGTFGNIKVSQREYPKRPSVKKPKQIAVTPLVLTADPVCPFSKHVKNPAKVH